VQTISENATLDVDIGDVAFWPEGKSLCVFFGRTPASVVNKPISERPVVIIGKTLASPDELREIKAGEKITVCLVTKPAYEGNKEDTHGDRKLTQSEIDVLVKRLLEERNKAQG
jgi:hypothetical protein